METNESTALVFADAEGHYYAISPELVRRCRVSDEAAAELRAGLSGGDTAGFLTPVPLPFVGATTNLSLLGAVQRSQFASLSSSLEKGGATFGLPGLPG